MRSYKKQRLDALLTSEDWLLPMKKLAQNRKNILELTRNNCCHDVLFIWNFFGFF